MTFKPGDGLKPGNKTKPKITSALGLEKQLKTAKPGDRLPDAEVPGLGLKVTSATRQSWVLRFGKKGRGHGLGPYPEVGLAKARHKAREAREKIRQGIDPIAERAALRAAQAASAQKKIVTFKQAAERFYAAKSGEWKTDKQRRNFISTMETYVYPTIGATDVAAVDRAAILAVLSPIWETKATVAKLLRIRLETILTYAEVHGYRSASDNPARWSGNLAVILPSHGRIRTVKHHAAMPYKDVPAFMARLRELEGVAALALEFLILTGGRIAEVCDATWGEIDREARLWRIPSARMKAGREHIAPLSAAAMAVLDRLAPEDAPRPAAHVFQGRIAGQAINPKTLENLLRQTLGVTKEEATPHGFRTSLRDWAGDETDYADEIAELTIAHKVGNDSRNAYRRSPAVRKRALLLEDWARYVGGETGGVGGENVVVGKFG
jgi:integrase